MTKKIKMESISVPFISAQLSRIGTNSSSAPNSEDKTAPDRYWRRSDWCFANGCWSTAICNGGAKVSANEGTPWKFNGGALFGGCRPNRCWNSWSSVCSLWLWFRVAVEHRRRVCKIRHGSVHIYVANPLWRIRRALRWRGAVARACHGIKFPHVTPRQGCVTGIGCPPVALWPPVVLPGWPDAHGVVIAQLLHDVLGLFAKFENVALDVTWWLREKRTDPNSVKASRLASFKLPFASGYCGERVHFVNSRMSTCRATLK